MTLTRSTLDLLAAPAALARSPSPAVSRYELMTHVQGYDHEGCVQSELCLRLAKSRPGAVRPRRARDRCYR